MPSREEKGAAFRALHEGEPFVIANAADAGSARVLESLGFSAIATTSSGFAFTLGRGDGQVTLDEKAAHIAALAAVTTVPLSADLENGYGPRPEDAAEAIRRAAEAGAVGGSIEDWDRDEARLYDVGEATERVAAAVEAARGAGFPFTLTARAEGRLRDGPGLDDTIARLRAYEEAGADVVFAPGLRTIEEVRAVCDAATKPVNVLGHRGFTLAELAEAGAQRISVGGAFTWVAVAALTDAATRIRDDGDLSVLNARPPF